LSYLQHRTYYRRNLPHYQPDNAMLFITFRLTGSLPRHVGEQQRDRRRRASPAPVPNADGAQVNDSSAAEVAFQRWDSELDAVSQGSVWLKKPAVASVVSEAIRDRDRNMYALDAYCVMPNQVHLVCTPLSSPDKGLHSLAAIMKSLKGSTARRCNQLLQRHGTFWQQEYYDHSIRDDHEWQRTVEYIVYNPVAAGLVDEWDDWPWTYCPAWAE